MKKSRYILLLALFAAIIGTLHFKTRVSRFDIGRPEVYDLSHPGQEADLSAGMVDLESGGILKIKNIDSYIGSDFTIDFTLHYKTKLGLNIGFSNDAGPFDGLKIERDDRRLSEAEVYGIRIKGEGNRIYVLADGIVQAYWNSPMGQRGDLVIDAGRSSVRIDNLEIRSDIKGNAAVTLKDDFERGSFYSSQMLVTVLVILSLVFVWHFIETLVYRKREPALKARREKSLLSGLGFAALLFVCGAALPGFEWLKDISLAAFVYHRIRFRLLNEKKLSDESEFGAKGKALSVIFLASAAIFTFCLNLKAYGSQGLWPAAAMTFALYLLMPLVVYRFGAVNSIAGSFLKFGLTALAPAVIAGLICLGDWDSDFGWNITALYPAAILIYLLPIRANIKNIHRYGLLMLLVTALFVLAVEGALRTSPQPGRFRPMNIGNSFEEDDLLFWAPKGFFPFGQDFQYKESFSVRTINFRSGATTSAKPENVFRIMVLGGSNTYGQGIDENFNTFSGVLQKLANQGTAGPKFEVINSGVPGYNSFQLSILFEHFGVKYEPDLVICYLGRNDATAGRGIYTLREIKQMAHSKKGRLIKTTQKLMGSFATYNAITGSVVRMRRDILPAKFAESMLKPVLPHEDFRGNLEHIQSVASANGAKVLFASEFWGEPFLYMRKFDTAGFFRYMEKAAQNTGAGYLDTFSLMAEYPLYDVIFREDPVHINADGHQIVAKLIYEYLVKNGYIPAN